MSNHLSPDVQYLIDDIVIQMGRNHRSFSPYDVRVALTDRRITKKGLEAILKEIKAPTTTAEDIKRLLNIPDARDKTG